MKGNRARGLSILVTAFLALLGGAAWGREQVGSIAYLEDGVTVTRGGSALDGVDIGTRIENLDLLATDRTGFAELTINSARSPETVLKVSPNTTFYFELDGTGKKDATTFQLLSGSLALKVQKVTGQKSLSVRTETATMGVRGTEFQVTISPAGDLLVATVEGQVACRNEDGEELLAQPGQVVEQVDGEGFRAVPVAVSSLETFRREWYAQRLEVFKSNALGAVRAYGVRYLDLADRFNKAHASLMSHSQVLRKWIQEDRQDRIGGRAETIREKKELIRDLLAIRRILFLYERVYFRVQELADYHDQGYGRGQLQAGLSTSAFFQRFKRERAALEEKMGQVRYVYKLYAQRNDGAFPTDAFSSDEGEDSFLDEGDMDLEAEGF